MTLKILILGANGFIGSNLTEHVLQHREDWHIFAMDLANDKLTPWLNHPRFNFFEGDITVHQEWLTYHVKKCDVILPLVAIANPAIYVQDPLRVFELDFEANLHIVKLCAKYKKRLIFPSTSEVYGMCPDQAFDEETSPLVVGPINKQRWIYSCSKQMLDRVIHAYGMRDNLSYTLFRPFNWMGPRLDNILNPAEGSSRAFSQFIGNILQGKPISLVNGGEQRRSFTYIGDALQALVKIIENRDGCAEQQIFNIGNPHNDVSIRELAQLLIAQVKTYPAHAANAAKTQLLDTPSEEYFGKGYQDVGARVPAIEKALRYLEWQPTTTLKAAIKHTLDYYLL